MGNPRFEQGSAGIALIDFVHLRDTSGERERSQACKPGIQRDVAFESKHFPTSFLHRGMDVQFAFQSAMHRTLIRYLQ